MSNSSNVPAYANEIGVYVSDVDVQLVFAVRIGAAEEQVEEVARVVLARPIAERFHKFLKEKMELDASGSEAAQEEVEA
jgi:phosphoribosylformylglycinamidine (FGAM) synthase PurS component